MFSKAAKPPGGAAPPSTRKPPVASLIASGVAIRGDLATSGDLHLDGALEGDVKVGRLTIGETGAVKGTIEAESVEIRGRVLGSVKARHVRLCATGHVDGDISHAELAIEAGARFEGRSHTFEPAAPEPAPVARAAE